MDGNFQYGWEPLKNRMFAEANGAVCNTLITSSNLVVASLMRASESFVYKDSGVFALPEKVCEIYTGKRDANRLRKEHRKKEI